MTYSDSGSNVNRQGDTGAADAADAGSAVSAGDTRPTVDLVTVLEARRGQRATKRFWRNAKGEVVKDDYNAGWQFRAHLHPVRNPEELWALVQRLQNDPRRLMVRGRVRPDLKRRRLPDGGMVVEPLIRRAVEPNQRGEEPGLVRDCARWAMFDCDGLELPDGLDVVADPDAVIDHVLELLPPEFDDLAMVFQWSSSMGFVGPGLAKFHVFVLLDRPCGHEELRDYVAARCDRIRFDPAPFRPAQPNYVAAPVFDGVDDLLAGRRAVFLEGERERLVLPPPEVVERDLGERAKTCGRSIDELRDLPAGWRNKLAAMGDGDGLAGFHQPLRDGAASFVASGYGPGDHELFKAAAREAIRAAPGSDAPQRRADVTRYASDAYLDDILKSAAAKFWHDPRADFPDDLDDDEPDDGAAGAEAGDRDGGPGSQGQDGNEPDFDTPEGWTRQQVLDRTLELVRRALAGQLDYPLRCYVAHWHEANVIGAIEAVGRVGLALAKIDRSMPRAHAELVQSLVDEILMLTGDVPALVDGEVIGWVLGEMRVRAPTRYQDVRGELTAHASWKKRGVRPFDQIVKQNHARFDAKRRKAGQRAAQPDDDQDDRPIIRCSGGGQHLDADRIERALIASGDAFGTDPVFSFDNRLVAVRQDTPRTVKQKTRAGYVEYQPMPVIRTFNQHSLRKRILQTVRPQYFKPLTQEWVDAPPSPDLVNTILHAHNGSRVLTGIAEGPVMMSDGRVLTDPGYDQESGLLAVFDPAAFPPVPEWPDRDDARAAYRALVDEALEGFEFATPLDETIAVSAFLTCLCRRGIDAAPTYLSTSPKQSSGKSTLWDIACRLAFGRPVPVTPWPSSPEEMTKTLVAIMGEGHAATMFDNIADGTRIDSPPLAAAVTGSEFRSRLLGKNDNAALPTNTMWFLTGNRQRLAPDMATRVLPCEIAPKTHRPDLRNFTRHDLGGWCQLNRGRMVVAGLAIMRAYVLAADRDPGVQVQRRSRFDEWDRLVRSALVWLLGEVGDVARKFDVNHSTLVEQEGSTFDQVVEALRGTFGDAEFTTGDLWNRYQDEMNARSAGDDFDPTAPKPELMAALEALCPKGVGEASVRQKIIEVVNHVTPDGYRLVLSRDEASNARTRRWYRVVRVGA